MIGMLLMLGFGLFLAMGLPVAFALGLAPASALLAAGDMPIHRVAMLLAQKMFTGIDSVVLMAVPLFIFTGQVMAAGSMTTRLLALCGLIGGGFRGSLAAINVSVSMVFAGLSGAAVADTSAVGSILIPAMKDQGYDPEFSAALTASSSTIGPIIPPSIPFIIYGALSETSIAALFLAGMIPGMLLGLFMLAAVVMISRRRGYPAGDRPAHPIRVIKRSGPVLMLPLIILGGIFSGIFTPTESAGVAALYALILSGLFYREMSPKGLGEILISTGLTSSLVMMVIASANLFAWLMAAQEMPHSLAEAITALSLNKYLVFLMINLALLIIGAFLETTASLIILTPVLLPVMVALGIDPLHFGVVMVLNLVIGLTTPPVGVCLYIASSIGKTSLERTSLEMTPFLAASVAVLMLVTYWPALALSLPRWLGF